MDKIYRVDFLLAAKTIKTSRILLQIVVECDGHEFHEKTKAQASIDKTRERAIVSAGYRVLRFSGS